MHDVTISYRFLLYLPKNSIIIGDKRYISNKLENFWANFGIKLSTIFRKNMKKDNEYVIKREIRNGIETAFPIITSKFGKIIKATFIKGFLIKFKLFLLSYSFECFLKLNNKQKSLLFNYQFGLK